MHVILIEIVPFPMSLSGLSNELHSSLKLLSNIEDYSETRLLFATDSFTITVNEIMHITTLPWT